MKKLVIPPIIILILVGIGFGVLMYIRHRQPTGDVDLTVQGAGLLMRQAPSTNATNTTPTPSLQSGGTTNVKTQTGTKSQAVYDPQPVGRVTPGPDGEPY